MSELAALKRDMEGCSRCSLCKWIPMAQVKSWRFAKVCPSVDRFNFHAYSGGGKMIIANSVLEGRSEINDAVMEIIYKCQLCGACQVSCQAYRDDIDLADVLFALRAKCVEDGLVIPEHYMMIESMKREDNSLGLLKSDRGNWARDLDLPDINTRQVEVLFHAGCRFSYDEDLRDAVRNWALLFKNAGIDIGIAGKEEACCGGRAFEMGYQGEMGNFAEDMASRVKASGAKLLVTPCSDCYYTFKYLYPKNGMDLGVKVLHATEYVDLLIKEGKISPYKKVSMRVTYHDPCHLGRRGEIYKSGWSGDNKLLRPVKFKQMGTMGIFDPPRDIIRSIPGINFVEMERIREYSWCCGAGGGVYEAYPDFAGWTANDRIEEAKATGADAIVTACPWCERAFKDELESKGEEIKVYDVIDLLTMSLGGNNMKLLPEDMYRELENALGEENISQEPAVLDGYAWQPIFSLTPKKWISRPAAVALPKTTEEVQTVVRACNKYKVRFKAHSTGWAAWGGPSEEGELQIDLRRMNRIIELDEKNKYAVVEPYVCCGQLQAEAMKKGLNCHIIGAGPNTSPLASTTSGWGYGGTGLSTGYGGRNPLGVEWVLPDGELLKLGSPGSNAGWFSGDGPGPSLRGIMRGFSGAQGSIGVFTKCAIKLYPWYGPKEPKIKGVLLDVKTEVPETEKMFFVVAPSFKVFADVAYKIGNAEIAYWFCRSPLNAGVDLFMPRAADKIFESKPLRAMFKAFQHLGVAMLSSESKREVEYQEKVLRKIVVETGCILLDLSKMPGYGFWWWLLGVRSILTALTFRAGGDFLTSYGSPVEYDNAVRQVEVAQRVKQKYIDQGIFKDDLSDIGWGGIYEGTANWGHIETACMFDRRDGKAEGRSRYLEESAESTVEHTLGLGLSNLPPGAWKIYGPKLFNYHLWQAKVKKAFDPNSAGDQEWYVPPIDEIES